MRGRDIPEFEFDAAPLADTALGVFETMLVREGRPVWAGRHIERLAASVRALYDAELDPELDARVAEAAAGHALARLRVDVVPRAGAPPRIAVVVEQLDRGRVLPAPEATLATVRVRAGAGAHKLTDRAWLLRIEALAGPAVRPLLLTRSGALLETTRANVFLLHEGALTTPPADGAILPGVTRAAVLEHARRLDIAARELPLTLADLRAADIVLLSGSLAQLEHARVRGGERASEQAAARLAAALAVDREV
jgi:para-aminobenzoate synthetase/4-amino-4-deoxychorismate lyase